MINDDKDKDDDEVEVEIEFEVEPEENDDGVDPIWHDEEAQEEAWDNMFEDRWEDPWYRGFEDTGNAKDEDDKETDDVGKGKGSTAKKETGTTLGYTYSTGYKFCRHSGGAFLKLPCGRTVGGASDRGQWIPEHTKLLVDCAGDSFRWRPIKLSGKATILEKFIHSHEELTLDWTDGCAPEVKAGFWATLIGEMTEPGDHIVFTCVGGHGRTGTSIASVLIEHSGLNDTQAIKFIRENYCNKAVETKEQQEYLAQLYEIARIRMKQA
jgi:hypothetical protein